MPKTVHGSRSCGHKARTDDNTDHHKEKLGIEEGTRLKVDVEGEKVVLTKVPSLFDLAGTSKLTKDKAFRLDEMREEEWCFSRHTISGLYLQERTKSS